MSVKFSIIGFLIVVLGFTACNQKKQTPNDNEAMVTSSIVQEQWGVTKSGKKVTKYTLNNKNGVAVSIITYGGIIQSIKVPDTNGGQVDIALGFDNLSGYEGVHPYFGAIIGRYGNRIAKGSFEIDGTKYDLATNNGENHLHGGLKGFDKVVWEAKTIGDNKMELRYRSIDMEEGYPGNLDVMVSYQLTDANELVIDYLATTDQSTHVNLTNHTYFNLNSKGDILGHELQLNAEEYTPVGETLIPIGERASVSGTPFDFRIVKPIGQDIAADHEQIKIGGGYDHNYVLNDPSLEEPFAVFSSKESGIVVKSYTTEPGVQFYSGNFLDGSITGKNGIKYGKRSGLCLETQHFPNSPNQASFPSTLLEPGQKYQSTTIYKFGISKG